MEDSNMLSLGAKYLTICKEKKTKIIKNIKEATDSLTTQ